jgi:hypothetical protein
MKNITEKTLKKFGFHKEESRDTIDGVSDFYYYILKIGSLSLITNTDDVAKTDGWSVEIFDHGDFIICSKKELKKLINSLYCILDVE